MQRIALLDRKDMNPDQARVWDAATRDPDAPRGGPYPIYIRLPKLFEAMQRLRACLAAGPLSLRERQIVNLAVARHWNARYPWFAQARRSRAAGISDDVIDAINARATPMLSDGRERVCHELARELLSNKGLSDAAYKEAERQLGSDDLIGLVAQIGNFSMTCLSANAFGLSPPADDPTPLAE
ncbi:MAG TPA: carboxymuconolactone decarboxylase family protein [Stellaceae bacterium]|jgi:4-carboxymuconolactone decarboxylase